MKNNYLIERTYFNLDEAGIDLSKLVTPDEIGVKLTRLLALKYGASWVIYEDIHVEPWELSTPGTTRPSPEKVLQWENKFRYIYESTKDRFVKLIELYTEQSANLFNKLGSKSVTKFNDTPQNVNVGDTDEYTTTYSSIETEVIPAETINRLSAIHNNLKNLYEEWVNEFNPLFGTNLIK